MRTYASSVGLSFLITIFILLIINHFKTQKTGNIYDNGYDDTNKLSHEDVSYKDILISVGGIPTIYTHTPYFPEAHVPLTPFKAPLKIYPKDKLPKFLLYLPTILTPPGNQGACGSCWAFATLSMIADRISISTKGEIKRNLSVQQILGCFEPKTGCFGNSPEKLLDWLINNSYKMVPAEDYHYLQENNMRISKYCLPNTYGINISPPVYSITKFIPEKNPDKQILLENIQNMKKELHTNGPFVCAMTVYLDLYAFDGLKVYEHSTDNLVGGHAITIVGYCDEGIDYRQGVGGRGYWICKTSWNNFPRLTMDKGYFAIRMGVNECGIEARCCGISVKGYTPKDFSSTRFEDFADYIDYSRLRLFM